MVFKLYTIFLGPKKPHGLQLFNIQHSTVRRVTFVPSPRGRPGCLHKDVLRKSGSSFSSCAGTHGGIHSSACGFIKSGKKPPLFKWKIHLQMVNVPLKWNSLHSNTHESAAYLMYVHYVYNVYNMHTTDSPSPICILLISIFVQW